MMRLLTYIKEQEDKEEHGHTKNDQKSPTYQTWQAMLTRCSNKNHEKYPIYGGKGIKVCKKWQDSFEAFLKDMGERPAGKTIDRINGKGDYTPANCRWASSKQQRANE